MDFWDLLKRIDNNFAYTVSELSTVDNPSPETLGLMRALFLARKTIADMPMNNRKAIDQSAEQLRKAWDRYTSSFRRRQVSAREQAAYLGLRLAAQAYLNAGQINMKKSLNAVDACVGEVLSADMDAVIDASREKFTISWGDSDYEKRDPKDAVGLLLWVGENVPAAERIGIYDNTLKKSLPHRDYDELINYIENAAPEKQMQYAMLLANRERQLTQKLAGNYRTYITRYENQPDFKQNLSEALVNDDSYRQLKSYLALKKRLSRGPFAYPLHLATRRLVTADVKSGIDVAKLIDGSTEAYLRDTDRGRSALRRAADKDMAILSTSGLPVHPVGQQVFALAKQLASEKAKSSSPFYGIARQVSLLMKMDHSDPTSLNYEKRIRACLISAQSYLQTHKLVPYSQTGKSRVALARQVAAFMQDRLRNVREERRRLAAGQAGQNGQQPAREMLTAQEAAVLENKEKKTAAELSRLSRYQANVGTARIQTQVPSVHSVAGARKNPVIRGLLHTAYNHISNQEQGSIGIIGNTIGLGKQIKKNYQKKNGTENVPLPYDSEHVPGMRQDKFREPKPGEIITDKRRIPLVWEHPIPEDPVPEISLTFEVDQPYEGSDIASNWKGNRCGHAFLTLKYTKVNPATGRPMRYKTSFGYYPKQGASTNMMNMAMFTIGSSVIGEIRNDRWHDVSVGATVNITPEQFNDIIRFTGEYERGGYNAFSRNCTDFALEAVHHAGVDIPELKNVKKVDVTNTGFGGVPVFAADAVVGHVLQHELVKEHMQKRGQTPDSSQYTRIGHMQAGKEDVERTSRVKLNSRMMGHVPAETAETIRGSFGFSLHSRKNLGIEPVDSDSGSINRMGDRLLEKMEAEIPRLRRKIESVYGRGNTQLNQVLDKMEKFQRTSFSAMREYAGKCQSKALLDSAETRENAMVNLFEGTKEINTYIGEMNNIFHDVFKSDPRVNIAFQNTVSLAENLREHFYEIYDYGCRMDGKRRLGDRTLKGDMWDSSPDRRLYKIECQLYNQSNDTADAMWNANHIEFQYSVSNGKTIQKERMIPAELLAAMLSFDDPEGAIRRFALEPDDKKTKEMLNVRDTMVSALETFQDGHEYTDAELDAVFNRLPALEKKLNVKSGASSSVYQTFALSAILGEKFLGNLDDDFKSMAAKRENRLERTVSREELEEKEHQYTDMRKGVQAGLEEKYSEYLKRAERELIQLRKDYDAQNKTVGPEIVDLMKEFSGTVRKRLEEGIRSLPQEKKRKLDHVAEIMAEGIMKERGLEESAANRESCLVQAKENLGKALVQNYANSIGRKAIKQMHHNEKLEKNIVEIAENWSGHVSSGSMIPSEFRKKEYVTKIGFKDIEDAGRRSDVSEDIKETRQKEKKKNALPNMPETNRNYWAEDSFDEIDLMDMEIPKKKTKSRQNH